MAIKLIFVLGASGAGKSYLFNAVNGYIADQLDEQRNPKIGFVQVGKILRAKYPPEYFKGSSSPAHTQAEALQICRDEVDRNIKEGKELILIDGQPRNVGQFDTIANEYFKNPLYSWVCLHLYAPREVREQRQRIQYIHDPSALQLALTRIEGDLASLYDVVTRIHDLDSSRVITFDTSRDGYDARKAFGYANILTNRSFGVV